MKRLKILSLVIGSTLLLGGCSSNDSERLNNKVAETEPVVLRVWGGTNDQKLLTEMVESFEAAYADQADFEITVEAEDEGTCKDAILGDVNAAPDVFAFADDQLMQLAAAGVIEGIEDTNELKAANLEGAVDAVSLNESVYAYPMTADNGYFMFYNKKYLSEEDVKTLDKVLEVAGSLNKKMAMDWSSGWYLYSFFGNTGLTLGLNEDGITNYCNWNSREGEIKGTDIGNAMAAIAKNPGFISAGDEGLIAGAKDGSVIAGISGVWSASELQEAWGNNFAAVKLPTYTVAGKQVQMASYAGYKLIGVNAYSEEKEWAIKLAEWLTNEENQRLRFVERGLGPSNTNVSDSKEVSENAVIQALISQSEYAQLQRVGAKYWDPVSAFGGMLVNGSAHAGNMQTVMDTMVKEITMKVTDR